MVDGPHGCQDDLCEHRARARRLRVISWNLLRLVGARVTDVASLIEHYRPDVLLMQEATEELAGLTAIAGGHFFREPLHGRIYGLAVWSREPLAPPHALSLPVSVMPGRVPPRLAQILRVGDITLANVHLSHGQFLNRWQLLQVARSLEGPAAIIGDYNAVGPIMLDGFRDIGPDQPTHMAGNIVSFRLDRCMARGLRSIRGEVLERGPSDHHPIMLDLDIAPASRTPSELRLFLLEARARRETLRVGMTNWLRALSLSRSRILVPQIVAKGTRSRRNKARRAAARRLAQAGAADSSESRRQRARLDFS